jgi:hypothetical protein
MQIPVYSQSFEKLEEIARSHVTLRASSRGQMPESHANRVHTAARETCTKKALVRIVKTGH